VKDLIRSWQTLETQSRERVVRGRIPQSVVRVRTKSTVATHSCCGLRTVNDGLQTPELHTLAYPGLSRQHARAFKARKGIRSMKSTAEDEVTPRQPRQRLRFELIFASLWLAFGLFLLPAVIYMVGTLLLGPYGENQGLGAFYADFFKDLVEPAGRAWVLALGPLVVVSILRLVFLGKKPHEDSEPEPQAGAAQPSPPRSRVEPRVSGD
jgi:hypothetical protein